MAVVDAELDETDVPDTAGDYIAVANKYDQLVKALDSMQHLELLDSNVISLQQRLKDRSDEYTDRAREVEPDEPDYYDDDSRLESEETIDLKEFFTDL